MSLEAEINAYFVKTKSSEDDSEDFQTAATVLRSHVAENAIRHIKASEGYPLIASGQLTKKDVFIFDHFDGDFFKQLQQTKSLIIGARCLLVCLLNNQPIPYGRSPVYTTAMRDLKISASGITPQEKEKLSIKIQWMGGYYLQNFGRAVTHLISNTIKSSKYEHASLNGIPVMHIDWVQRVWERSLVDYISATDDEFDKYRLPIFFDINVTSTGLDTAKKEDVMRLVQENGGTYHRAFRPQLVDIVVTEKGKTDSEKYKVAQRLKKDILAIEWIFDSITRGFALPTKDYQVKSLKVSTPTKPDQSIADFTSNDCTQLSEISRIPGPTKATATPDLTVNDSVCSNANDARKSTKSGTFQAPQLPPPSTTTTNTRANGSILQRDLLLKNQDNNALNYRSVLEEISPREAKKAGNFLDGCCVYLSGFRNAEKEKLNRILNVGGATRYDAINDEITHIIVGQITDADFKAWKKSGLRSSAHIVRLDWLLESIKLKQTASEHIFRVSLPPGSREPDAPSPSSKKTLRSMNHSFKQPADLPKTKKKLFTADDDKNPQSNDEAQLSGVPRACSTALPVQEDDDEHALLAQYSQENLLNAAPAALPLKQVTSAPPAMESTLRAAGNAAAAAATAALSQNTEFTASSFDYEHLDVFKNLVIYVHRQNFPDDLYTQLQRECEAAQANVVQQNFQDPIDYAVVTFEATFDAARLPVKAKIIINELYVETCLKDNKLVPIEYFHRPIPIHTANTQPLKGMIIVISTYANFEREYIEALAKLMGAQVKDIFAKKEKPLLICPEAKGAKYLGALKWRFPVVTSAWLLQCATDGVKLPLTPYLVGEAAAEFPSPNTTQRGSFEDDENTRPTTSKKAPETAATSKADEYTPLRHKRVAALAAPLGTPTAVTPNSSGNSNLSPSAAIDSPHTPANNAYGGATYKFEYMEKILDDIEDAADREFVRGIIEDIRANPTPELERIKRQLCTPANRRHSTSTTPNAVLHYCSTPEFKRRMAEELDKRWHLPTKKLKPDTPLDQIRKRVILATCRDLGIDVSSDEDCENLSGRATTKATSPKGAAAASTLQCNNVVTPLQHRSTSLSSTKSKSKAEPRTIFSLASISPTAADKQRRQTAGNDHLYVPNTQEAAGVSTADGGVGDMRASLLGKSTIDFDKISFEDTTTTNALPPAAVDSLRKSTTPKSAAVSPELQQIKDYLKARESKRQSARKSKLTDDELENRQNQPTTAGHVGGDMAMEIETATQAMCVQPFETEQFGFTQSDRMDIAWQDPIDFNREKQAAKKRTMQYAGTPRFSISCADENREGIIEKIHKLGGEVSTNLANFDPACTHFVCERPNRAEKSLGCIAAGKWVLSLKYIEECFAKDNFIDEELYEWGNPKALNLPSITPEEQVVAQASFRWRCKLAEKAANGATDVGIFSGFRAILRINPKNQTALGNVIRAGKGVVIEADSPYSNCPSARTATHCFVDVKKFQLNKPDYDYLRKCGVKIAAFLYIQAYLTHGQEANFDEYEVKM